MARLRLRSGLSAPSAEIVLLSLKRNYLFYSKVQKFKYRLSILEFLHFIVVQSLTLQRLQPNVWEKQKFSAVQAGDCQFCLFIEKVAVGKAGGIAGAEVTEKAGSVAREARTFPCAGVCDHDPAFSVRIILHQGACA